MYNIIVIDDHKMLREMISETLNTRGFNVVASSGDAKDSVSLCEKFKPDLILMDICTENNSSGLAYSKIIKENFPSVKIILMTGVPDLTFIDKAKANNVDSFIMTINVKKNNHYDYFAYQPSSLSYRKMIKENKKNLKFY